MNENRLIIGTRKSALALRQTELVAEAIRKIEPRLQIDMETFHTMGDRILEKPLQEFGGKGVFVTELEQAILKGRMDLAVHSAKDMPMELSGGLEIVGVLKREDPRDVLVTLSRKSLSDFKKMIIGTSSPRRKLQLEILGLPRFPEMTCRMLRGNVQTRLRKLEIGDFDGIVLAAAGLKRLGLMGNPLYSFHFLDCSQFIPAGGQGILAIEGIPGTKAASLCREISDEESWISLKVERRVLKLLEAGCHEPIGVFCQVKGKKLILRGISQKGGRVCRILLEGEIGQEEELAIKAAKGLQE